MLLHMCLWIGSLLKQPQTLGADKYEKPQCYLHASTVHGFAFTDMKPHILSTVQNVTCFVLMHVYGMPSTQGWDPVLH